MQPKYIIIMINFRTLRLLIPLAICSLCIQLNAQTDSVYDGTVHYFWTGDGNHVRYGLMDTAGNVICRPSFSQIGVPYFDLKSEPVPATKGRKWGFINTKGEWVVRPQFEYAGDFHNGLAKVIVKGKTGYIRQDGTMAIEPRFEGGDYFFDTITLVFENNQSQYINTRGEILFGEKFCYAWPFQDGVAEGSTCEFNEGEEELWGAINANGEYIFTPQFEEPPRFLNNTTALAMKDRLWGVIGVDGHWIVSPKYDYACHAWAGDLAWVRTESDEKWSLIGSNGKVITAQKFDDRDAFNEGLAAVKIGDRYGFIDTTGTVVFTLEPEYYPLHFSDGLALVVQTVDSTDRWGYINKKGEWVIPPQFSDANHFHGGLAYVILSDDPKDRRSGYINHRGQVVWQFKDKYPIEIWRF